MTSEPAYFPPPTHNVPTIWREKSVLVMNKQAPLPSRCVKCNVPTQITLKRNLRWHHPALYILVVGGLLLYLILAMVVSKTATIYVGLCETHVAARKRDMLIAWLLVLLSFVSFYFTVTSDTLAWFLVTVVLLSTGILYGAIKTRIVAPQKIDDHYVYLTGINATYLEQFPERHAAQ